MEHIPKIESEVSLEDKEKWVKISFARIISVLGGVSLAAATIIAAKHFKNALAEAHALRKKGE